ncbi:hypothetical protein [Acinetobacter lactucae]|uniref:hypothetical protein n=1 Tax=Acinetobacter lactucae TaxID=1785128 RepID=UPI000F7A4F89|nr:hypothetical protein [Acinetobacter lactucae]RSO33883.1 hypothetical protein EA763_11285 [Acinetobacter lactucae]
MFKKILVEFKKDDVSIKFYKIGFLVFLIGVYFIFMGDLNVFSKMLYISLILIEAGFFIWFYNFFKNNFKFWYLRYLKYFWVFFNLATLWVANVYASLVVNASLGLPSSDFIYTVSFFTFICYIPASFFVAAILGLFCSLALIFFYLFSPVLNSILKRELLKRYFIFPIVGSLVTISLVDWGQGKIMSFYFYNSPKYVRAIAYKADYQYISKYLEKFPKVNKSMKIKLHENGVYSTLIETESGYDLKVDRIE